MNYKIVPLVILIEICEHHVSILEDASTIRVLSSEELDFWASYELFMHGLLLEDDFRIDAQKYFYDGQSKR